MLEELLLTVVLLAPHIHPDLRAIVRFVIVNGEI